MAIMTNVSCRGGASDGSAACVLFLPLDCKWRWSKNRWRILHQSHRSNVLVLWGGKASDIRSRMHRLFAIDCEIKDLCFNHSSFRNRVQLSDNIMKERYHREYGFTGVISVKIVNTITFAFAHRKSSSRSWWDTRKLKFHKIQYSKVSSCAIAVMKLSILLFLNIAVASSAVPCGKWYTTDCLADSDIRYDASASNKIVDQNEIWAHQAVSSIPYDDETLHNNL